MEITWKGILATLAPIVVTSLLGIADNAIKWRQEMDQKTYDRQTRILDKIMEIQDGSQRLAVAEFYLRSGIFKGQLQVELESAIAQAQHEAAEKQQLAELEQERRDREKLLAKVAEPKPSMSIPKVVASPPPPKEPDIVIQEPPKTIFSFDRPANISNQN